MYEIKGISETLYYKYELSPATEQEIKEASPILEEDDKLFYLEKLVGKKLRNGLVHFLVKWQKFPDSQNSWEARHKLIKTPLLKNVIGRFDISL